MNSTRRISIATGTLLLLGTATALLAAALVPALTPGSDYLMGVAGQSSRMAAAVLVYLLAAGASVGIAIALYPVLKKAGAALALGSVVFRTIEAVMYTVAAVSLLSVLTLGQRLATASAVDHAPLRVMADSFLSVRDHSNLAAVVAYSTGALIYYAVFYQCRLVPRWLSVWGIAGVLLILTACMFALFRNNAVTRYTLLVLPIAVQEDVLAVWLLVKGFSPSPLTPRASSDTAAMTTTLGDAAAPGNRSAGDH
jgi:hypothetical protein